jgi:hypothetical protein
VLGALEAEKLSLLLRGALDWLEDDVAESYPDVDMLEDADPIKDDCWLRRSHHHHGVDGDETGKDCHATLHPFSCCT